MRTAVPLALSSCLVLLNGGCAASWPDTLLNPPAAPAVTASPQTTPAEPLALPRDRQGCLPFPGLFTLYAKADPARLGEHRYGRSGGDGPAEEERGIFYTTRAGFLDLAHVRNTIDWTRYCVQNVAVAIARGDTEVAFNGTNGSMAHLAFRYPADWSACPAADRPRRDFDLSLRLGERIAYVLMNWHETASWFGDHTFLFDESPSAFTWDDVMSHVIGVRVAELALCSEGWTFDQAVTYYLADQLRTLGAVGPEQTQQAVDAVEGRWWAHGGPLKRQLDLGFESGTVTPWLVGGLPVGGDATAGPIAGPIATPIAVPAVWTAAGRKLSAFCRVRIDPRCAAADRMRDSLPGRPEWFDVDTDLPIVMATMRGEMTERFGPTVADPRDPSEKPTTGP